MNDHLKIYNRNKKTNFILIIMIAGFYCIQAVLIVSKRALKRLMPPT